MTMRMNNFKAILKAALRVASILPFAAVVAFGQQTVNLTAAPTTTTMPDGTTVPMWGYFCGTAATTNIAPVATCAALNPASVSTVATVPSTWSPVVITVPSGQALTISLTNSLSFTAGTGTNTVPTSIMIVGQVGGGLGILAQRTTTLSPDHSNLVSSTVPWPIAGSAPAFMPPPQGPRVQSFSTEVLAGVTTALTWAAPRPGTYLIESGTHPSIQGPMGLYGILVVTTVPAGTTAGTAYPAVGTAGTPGAVPAVTYNAEVPVEFSEIDPVQNNSVNAAVTTAGFSETAVWSHLANGGPVTSIAVTSAGSAYTATPTVTISGAGSNATAVATLTGGAVTAITITNAGDGYSSAVGSTSVTITPATGDTTGTGAAAAATVTMGGCGGGAHTCYPPAVN